MKTISYSVGGIDYEIGINLLGQIKWWCLSPYGDSMISDTNFPTIEAAKESARRHAETVKGGE